MIILRKLFSKRRGLTPEQEELRELRNKVFKNEFPKLGISHFFDKSEAFRSGGEGSYNKFTGNMNEDILNVMLSRGNRKESKKMIKGIKKGKKGVISFHPDAPFHVQIHEPGHPASIAYARSAKESEIANLNETVNDIPIHEDMSLEEAKKAQAERKVVGEKMIERERLANKAGRDMLERQGASNKVLEQFGKDRKQALDSYRKGARMANKDSKKIIKKIIKKLK